MNSFFARQPILSKNLTVKGYELLYRDTADSEQFNPQTNAERATSSILEGFHSVGIDRLANRKRAFVNFPERMLLDRIYTLFRREELVVEVLETVQPSTELLEVLHDLRQRGFTVALDDFVFRDELAPMLRYANIIKLEYGKKLRETLREILPRIDLNHTSLLAERIETAEDFEAAKAMGFTLFQGFFFCKPVILSKPDMTPTKVNALQLLTLAFKPEVDFFAISRIVRRDLAMSLRVLRMVNSAYFGLRNRITDIHQAVVFLGERELKKWLSLVTMTGLADEKPNELVHMSLVRANMCELLAKSFGPRSQSEEYFLVGLFSLVDTLMECSIDDALAELPLSDLVTAALVRHEGRGYLFLAVTLALERCDWEEAARLAQTLGASETEIAGLYAQALAQASQISY